MSLATAHVGARTLDAGTDPRRPLAATRLLVAAGTEPIAHRRVGDLTELLAPGDLLVLNDAATLPASLHGELLGAPIEARIAGAASAEDFPSHMRVVLFGSGDWRWDTDTRPRPPPAPEGATLRFGDLEARVLSSSPLSPRLLHVEWDRAGDALAEALYAIGQPVQYRHLRAPLRLAEVQTPYASRPWAVEMPSTGRPLSWALLDRLAARGVEHVFLTHAAGLSATGDPALDRALPLPERFELPAPSARRIARARARGGRVVAVGTTVVRALETAAAAGHLRSGFGLATLRLRPDHRRRIVDGILTGIHAPGESHFDLLGAFASPEVLASAYTEAVHGGYLAHELGDLMLLVPPTPQDGGGGGGRLELVSSASTGSRAQVLTPGSIR